MKSPLSTTTIGPNIIESDITISDQPVAPRRVIRRQNNSNPLVSRRHPAPSVIAAKPAVPRGARYASEQRPPRPLQLSAPPAPPTFTETTEDEWQTFKLTTTKASILYGLRHHVMRLYSKKIVDPTDPDQFCRPIRLHRRDPAAPLQGAQSVQAASAQAAEDSNLNPEERAKLEAERAQKDAERTATLEKIAPYGGAQKQKQNAFKKKTQQVFKQNPAEKRLRYEEQIPWFIEDFDNKNTWQGQLESELSNGSYAMFVLDGSNFRMIPIEKWYKFSEKNRFQTMNIEEAEQALKKSSKTPRWVMKLTKQDEKDRAREEREQNMKQFTSGFNTRKGGRLDDILPKSETADADELDFDDDRFADDEEAPVMEGEEQENKEIEQRIKKEQLSANSFNLRDEKDYEEEEKERKTLQKKLKANKRVKRFLMKREGNFTYEDDDSDKNPYASTSEDSDDDEELARKEEERKKEEEQKKKEQEAKELEKGKKPVVIPETKSKAPTTKKTAKLAPPVTDPKNSKRSGSVDLSESGNEKSRKKPRKPQSASSNSAAVTTGVGKGTQKKRKAGGDGSGEDTAGEMSDGASAAKKPRGINVLPTNRRLSPSTNSRHGSPVPGNTTSSRAASPATVQPLTDDEIKALFINGPITTQQIAKSLGNRLRNPSVKAALVAALKRMTTTRDKLLHLKE